MKLRLMGVLLVRIGAMTAAVAIAQNSGPPLDGSSPGRMSCGTYLITTVT